MEGVNEGCERRVWTEGVNGGCERRAWTPMHDRERRLIQPLFDPHDPTTTAGGIGASIYCHAAQPSNTTGADICS